MPKRKAVGPVDSSDGEDDDFYPSPFSATPVQPPFPKLVSNNFNLPSSQKTSVPASTSSSLFNFGASSSKRPVFGNRASPSVGLGSKSLGSPMKSVESTSTSTNSSPASGSRNQEFSKGMRDLNSAFQISVRNAMSKNPFHSLLPLVKDYLFHSRVLLEHYKRGGAQAELVNGINLPPKCFKSLGEFFDDFESRYVHNQGDEPSAGTSSSSSALNSKYSSGISTEPGTKSNFNSTFTTITSPSKSIEGTKVVSFASLESTSAKVNSLPLSSTSTPSKLETSKTISSGFFTSSISSAPSPLKTTSLSTSTSKPSIEPTPAVSKPPTAAPFTGFSFFTPPAPSTSLALGSFPATKPTTATASTSEDKTNEEDGEDDEPPKVEITPVKEDDAVYSIRCKVFGVVEGKCKDKGIGMLYVKKLEDGRHQIVVRADNNLGTVILNILLQEKLPLEKNGKNTIMTMDLQANDKKGMPIIIRVKTEEDALELLGKLKDLQKSS